MSPSRRPPLRRMLTLALAAVSLGAVLLTAGLTLGLFRISGERNALAALRADAVRLARIQTELDAGRLRPGAVRRAVGDVRFVPDGRPSPFAGLAPSGRTTIEGRDVYYASVPLTLRERSGTLYVVRTAADAAGPPPGLAARVAIAGALALAVSAAVALAVARRMSRPLADLAAAARGVARGERVWMPPGDEPQEVDELRRSFADMAAHLDAARQVERTFLLSVSHELRTPLTAIRGYGEALADGTARGGAEAGRVIVAESKRLERLVGDLIDLARLQAGEFSVAVEEVDLGRLVRSTVESFKPRASEAEVRLEARTDVPGRVETDPDRVHQMIANLVENALRVTPAAGTVAVTAAGATITVADSGPGLAPDDIAHAFERFYLWRRYTGERPVGTGLGLAIVGELARLLGIRIDVGSSASGTTFTLRFDA